MRPDIPLLCVAMGPGDRPPKPAVDATMLGSGDTFLSDRKPTDLDPASWCFYWCGLLLSDVTRRVQAEPGSSARSGEPDSGWQRDERDPANQHPVDTRL